MQVGVLEFKLEFELRFKLELVWVGVGVGVQVRVRVQVAVQAQCDVRSSMIASKFSRWDHLIYSKWPPIKVPVIMT